jgi:hypothetical protein
MDMLLNDKMKNRIRRDLLGQHKIENCTILIEKVEFDDFQEHTLVNVKFLYLDKSASWNKVENYIKGILENFGVEHLSLSEIDINDYFREWLSSKLGITVGSSITFNANGCTYKIDKFRSLVLMNWQEDVYARLVNKNIEGVQKVYAVGQIDVPMKFKGKKSHTYEGIWLLNFDRTSSWNDRTLYYAIVENITFDKILSGKIDYVIAHLWSENKHSFGFDVKMYPSFIGKNFLHCYVNGLEQKYMDGFINYVRDQKPEFFPLLERLCQIMDNLLKIGFKWSYLSPQDFGYNSKGEVIATNVSNGDFQREHFKDPIKNHIKEEVDKEEVKKMLNYLNKKFLNKKYPVENFFMEIFQINYYITWTNKILFNFHYFLEKEFDSDFILAKQQKLFALREAEETVENMGCIFEYDFHYYFRPRNVNEQEEKANKQEKMDINVEKQMLGREYLYLDVSNNRKVITKVEKVEKGSRGLYKFTLRQSRDSTYGLWKAIDAIAQEMENYGFDNFEYHVNEEPMTLNEARQPEEFKQNFKKIATYFKKKHWADENIDVKLKRAFSKGNDIYLYFFVKYLHDWSLRDFKKWEALNKWKKENYSKLTNTFVSVFPEKNVYVAFFDPNLKFIDMDNISADVEDMGENF